MRSITATLVSMAVVARLTRAAIPGETFGTAMKACYTAPGSKGCVAWSVKRPLCIHFHIFFLFPHAMIRLMTIRSTCCPFGVGRLESSWMCWCTTQGHPGC